jgi:hypothetical protein
LHLHIPTFIPGVQNKELQLFKPTVYTTRFGRQRQARPQPFPSLTTTGSKNGATHKKTN